MTRRIWIVILSLSLLFSLTACGTAGQQNPEISEISENSSYESAKLKCLPKIRR